MAENIYLTGFMGSGKTTVGQDLAALLGRRLIDLDQEIEKQLGMPISQAFSELGEKAFRSAERQELERVAALPGLVVATGGGLPGFKANRELMRSSGRIVHLHASLEECRRRLGDRAREDRPLWRDPSAVSLLYQKRRRAYGDCDRRVAVDGRENSEIVEEIGGWLLPDDSFPASLEGVSTPVTASFDAPRVLAGLLKGKRAAILCDRHLAELHLPRFQAALGDPLVITLTPGEGSKTLRGAEKVYQALLEARLERGDFLVALGGGMITDLGAFVGATFKRGMQFILVSTSLLGCVDAAVGGKAGVNLGLAKNSVGCFTHPQAVILDLRALSTLPKAQRAEGLVEAYKTGLVASAELAHLVQRRASAILDGDLELLARSAALSARAKAQVVAQDFREGGVRRILNLGHTYGHAVEGLSRFKISHGRSVALGVMVAAILSQRRGLLDPKEASTMVETMAPLAPPPDRWPSAASAWPMMEHDKKNQGGKVLFVFLKGVGQPLWTDDLTQKELAGALRELRG